MHRMVRSCSSTIRFIRLRTTFLVGVSLPWFPAWGTDFGRDVLPVLQRACFECHGPERQKGGLRLDARDSFIKGGSDGPVIVAGQPDQSELLRRIALPKGHKEVMPNRGELLKTSEIAAIRSWIAEGASWPDQITTLTHWAYVAPRKPPLPPLKHDAWTRNEIDHFILARLEAAGLEPSPEAPSAVLIRRLSLDLTGLPPSLDVIDKYAHTLASHPGAYETLVDELLASDEFGVKWARHWLDLARYADSHGFQRDDLREIWAYRDWVVNALNAGMPFDQFTIEQVAGDLLPNARPQQIIATGFHRCTPTNVEAGTEPEESRVNQVLDRVNTTGAVWMGTTLECCQCHNHKYDPFTMRDYYQLVAYFNNTEKEAERTNPKAPGSIQFSGSPLALADPVREAERVRQSAELVRLDKQIAARKKILARAKDSSARGASLEEAIQPLAITGFTSENGSESQIQPDKSILLAGATPDTDVYTVELPISGSQITGLQLEALTHPSLPGGGPGRGDEQRTNFVLHEFEATLLPPDGQGQPRKLQFDRAYASFSQASWDVAGAVDGDPKTGWAIAPRFKESHWAAFALKEPLNVAAGSHLAVRLAQDFRGGRSIGCFRISAIRGAAPESVLPQTSDGGEEQKTQPARRKGRQKTPAARAVSADPQLAKLERERQALDKKLKELAPATTEVMKELPQPRVTTMFNRGVYTDPGEPVAPGTPAILPKPSAAQKSRLDLARWLVSRENPLAARVNVNRWWAEIFGHGIVTTVEDFGIKGEPPTHPELLDWLAVDFMDNGWSLKTLIKKIVMSSTYRQVSRVTPELLARDDQNLLYARGPRLRLDAEMIRDNALAIAGLISLSKGGPSIRPPQPDGLWQKVGGQQYNYAVSPGEQEYRRGIYVVLKRGSPYPSFVNFDGSARMACVVKRSRSNTPLQALTLLNDPVYAKAAGALAKRMMEEAPGTPARERIRFGFRLTLAREPSAAELAALVNLYSAKAARSELDALNDVATALLNLDETITKG